MSDLDPAALDAIRRRLPDIPREDMSNPELDRADLLAEVDRLAEALAEHRFMAGVDAEGMVRLRDERDQAQAELAADRPRQSGWAPQ